MDSHPPQLQGQKFGINYQNEEDENSPLLSLPIISSSDHGPNKTTPHAEQYSDDESAFSTFSSQVSHHKVPVGFTAINLANDVISISLVSAPYFFYSGGIYPICFILVALAIINSYTLDLVFRLCLRYRCKSLPEICERAMGKKGLYFALAAMFCYNMGVLIATLIGFNEYTTGLLDYWGGNVEGYDNDLVFFVGVAIIAPAAYLKNIAKFTITTNAAQIFLNASFLLMLAEFVRLICQHDNDNIPPPSNFVLQPSLLSAISGISYLYCCHDLAFHVLYSLKEPTRSRWAVVRWAPQIVLAVTFLLLGLLGAFYFGNTQNILSSMENSILVLITKILASLSLWLCIPYCVFMPRVVINTVLDNLQPHLASKTKENKLKRTAIHFGVTSSILVVCTFIASAVDGLGVFVEFVGIAGLCISTIIPPLCLLLLSDDYVATRENKMAMFVLCIGGLLFIGGIISFAFPSTATTTITIITTTTTTTTTTSINIFS